MAPFNAEAISVENESAAMELYYQKGWTDGLPIVPPTEERIKAMLDFVGMKKDTVIGSIPERGRVFTAEVAAINAVMAGCLPNYFPVVVTAVSAMGDPDFGLHGPTASTAGAAIMIIVNGPISKTLAMNAGENLFGPGNRANATIGRAIRLLMMNAGGSKEFDRSTLGHPGKFTYCIAENEDTEWEPLHVEKGFDRENSTVTVFAAEGPNQINNHASLRAENILLTLADRMTGLGTFNMGGETEMGVVLCPEHYRDLNKQGWNKASVRRFLYEHAKRPLSDLKKGGYIEAEMEEQDEKTMVHAVPYPESILLLTGGGDAGRFSACIPGWFGSNISRSVTKSILTETGFT
ncbi:hypothetical protein ACE1TI_14180 [Alteribacillus sp. JSM 102045]|uniref:hypothetical protein n=1 Tax=Alteribacillus sp. JSM 102045 TaxID=1562101 RepID=UPI0035BEBBF5